ncbi:MAG: hypothetical protein NVSMB51_14700 [Solirubrobacteraceae bacterium]
MSSSFGFVQFEYPWILGPPDGRLLLRAAPGEEAEQVVVVATLGAPQRRFLRGRRAAQAVPQPPPTPVAVTRATVIDAAPRADAGAWLDKADLEQTADGGLTTLNRVLQAFRIANANPYVSALQRGDAIAVRIGFGAGEQVAQGAWERALELPAIVPAHAPRRQGASALRPQERLAALLGARDRALDCEEVALRARLDLDAGRAAAAARETRVAIELALEELAPRDDLAERLNELDGLRGVPETEAVHALGRLEAALRARTAYGMQ